MSASWRDVLRAALGVGRSHRHHRRARPDRRRHHARRGRARARHAARRRRGDRRSDPRAVRAARHDDAGDQSPAGDGAARRGRAARTRNGTAPGLWIERGRTAIVLLPGPPREMKPMLEGGRFASGWRRGRAARVCSAACSRSPAAPNRTSTRRRQPIYAQVDVAGACRSARRFSRSSGRSSCT